MTDMIDLSQAQIVDAPDVHSWPITTAITQVSFDGSTTRVEFDKKDGPSRWPDVTPPGWTGPLEYTIWLFKNIGGRWVGSAFIQMWSGRDGSGSSADPDVPSVYDAHWYYGSRWAPIYGSGKIQPGEVIGFMVTPGNARDGGQVTLQERSNVVTFAATDHGTMHFDAAPVPVPVPVPIPIPVQVPTPAPVPVPVPVPQPDLVAQLNRIEAALAALTARPWPTYTGTVFGQAVVIKPK